MRSVGWLLTALTLIASTAQAATVEVGVGRDDGNIAYLKYDPQTVVVHVGDTVTWNAASNTPHTVTATPNRGPPAFDSTPALNPNDPALAEWFSPGGFLMPGQSFNRTFDRSGTFTYFCKIHPGMVGTIVVTNATSGQASGSTGLPLPGGGDVNRNVTQPGIYHVAAGWGAGDVSADLFGPSVTVVPVGSTVMWTNFHTSEPHTVTATPSGGPPAWDSSPKVTGEPVWWNAANGMMSLNGLNKQFSRTFDTAGHFPYFCKIHPGMVGTVVVLEKPMVNSTGGNTTGDGMTRNQSSGSTIPGPEAPLLALGLASAALLARRRRA